MKAQFVPLIEHFGFIIVLITVLVNQLGVPVPAVPVLIVAGAIAARASLFTPGLFMASIAACLVADCVWFTVGRSYGMRVLKTLCRISLEPDSCVSQTQNRFESWGANSLIFAKFIPGLATIAPPMAGALEVSWLRFLLLSIMGGTLWTVAYLGAGMIFTAQVDQIFTQLEHFGGLAAAGLAAAFAGYIAYKWRQRRRFYAELRMARIKVRDLHELIEAGAEPQILDVRTHTARNLEPSAIPTAIHAPIDEMEIRVKALARERAVVVYCTCPNEASAARVAKQLMNHGFKQVRPLLGGLDAWIAAGYGVDTIGVDVIR